MIFAGILFGIFLTHNIEQTNYFKCKYDKQVEACREIGE